MGGLHRFMPYYVIDNHSAYVCGGAAFGRILCPAEDTSRVTYSLFPIGGRFEMLLWVKMMSWFVAIWADHNSPPISATSLYQADKGYKFWGEFSFVSQVNDEKYCHGNSRLFLRQPSQLCHGSFMITYHQLSLPKWKHYGRALDTILYFR